MGYQPIENYGVIGDLHTVALIGMNGSIDWFCFPNFDSPSIFAALLDDEKGGRFQIAPTLGGVTFKQLYWPETNVLVTRFLSTVGVGEIIDYMPIDDTHRWEGKHQLVRRVQVVRGSMPFRMVCSPPSITLETGTRCRSFRREPVFNRRASYSGSPAGFRSEAMAMAASPLNSLWERMKARFFCSRPCPPAQAAANRSKNRARTNFFKAL